MVHREMNGYNLIQGEHQSINMRVQVNEKILVEACKYFPPEDDSKYPRAIRALFGGKRKFLIYFSNASNSSFQESINLLLATDVDNIENDRILEDLSNETLSIYGYNTEKYFKITKILKVPRLVGTVNNRVIKANVAFFINHDISAYGLPENLYQDIMHLPNAQSETRLIADRIAHWDEYLKINEKIAKETQVLLHYRGYRQSDHIMELIFSISHGALFCRVWDYAKGIFRQDIADFIEKHSIPNKFSIQTLFKPTGVAQDIRSLISKARLASDGAATQEKKVPIQVFRGGEIKPVFEKSLELPKEQLIIFSPWINETVVDGQMLGKFKKLAKKNVQILIGWGFSNSIGNEINSPSCELMQELLTIKNEVGIPMVCLLYLGNKHEKEVVIDSIIHIAGSFNWLSYRGDYRPRGESIYYIQDSEIVKKQRDYWENACIPAARESLFKAEAPIQKVAALQFLFRTLPSDAFYELCEELISQLIAEESPDMLYNVLGFCVINNQYIPGAVSAVSYILGLDEYSKKVKSILAYLKFHQAQDFKELCTDHDKKLKQEFGKNYSSITPSDCKEVVFLGPRVY